MITESDSHNTIEFDGYYAILPSSGEISRQEYLKHYDGAEVRKGYRYCSETNTEWLNIEDMRRLIKQHLYPDFEPIE